jgi:hypothetical protein
MTNSIPTAEKFSTCDFSDEPKRPLVVYDKPLVATAPRQGGDSPSPNDLDSALLEAAKEMKFDWPEFLPVERIKAGIMEIALGLFLFAALCAFCSFH